MIRYIDNLYLTDKTDKKLSGIKRKLRLGIGMPGMFVIMLSENDSDVFDIVPCSMFKIRKYRHMDHTIVGIAENRRSSYEIVERIITEHFNKTGRYTGLKDDFIGA